jgi:hypothetical protein
MSSELSKAIANLRGQIFVVSDPLKSEKPHCHVARATFATCQSYVHD